MNTAPLLHANISGSGKTLILLHGFLSSSQYWRKVQQLVDQNYRVIAIDLLGFGRSPKPRHGKYDYLEHIAAIRHTLDHHQVSGPFTLVGHSMGSLIALRYANLFPAEIRKLVLVNVPAMLGVDELKREIMGTSRINSWGLGRVRTRFTWAFVRGLYRLRLLPARAQAALKQNEYFFHHTVASRLGSFYNILGRNHLVEDLRDVPVSTVLLSGVHDKQIYLQNLKEKLALGGNVIHKIIPTGHHIPYMMPERIVNEIK